ncbi:putative receptor-like protein kinase At3g47110 isoform X3 [Euphorbia lathyris]|uniref:putative receptor-like protein kinase At3g47110 isoform X3 n=1 Tax=Euphorbia lathyris TaxID=212925 RepID=UPI0033137EFB
MEKINSFLVIVILCFMCFLKCLDEIRAISDINTDGDALLALKAHIINDPKNLLSSNWSKDTSICNWIGITCGIRHHRVRGIRLTNMSLTGTIPPQIGNLSFLVNFSLLNNSFHGFLPIELSNLHRLKFLKLGFNFFNGVIPSWIGSFSQLQYLSLDFNKFKGEIPKSIGNLINLEILSIRRNFIGGKIPLSIGNLTKLRAIDFDENKLAGERDYRRHSGYL